MTNNLIILAGFVPLPLNQDICCILQTDTWKNASCLINAFNTMSIVKSTPLGFQKDNIMIEL